MSLADNPWFDYKELKCVIPCAGKSTRFSKVAEQKVMAKVGGKPILGHIVDYWNKFVNSFIFVVGFAKESVIDYVSRLSIDAQFIEQREPRGIADAIMCVEDLVGDRFIVVLGDCICKGNFNFPSSMEQGVGVWETNNMAYIRQSYSVEVKYDLVCRVEEKPTRIINNLCGMGFYFFKDKIFEYIKITKPSKLRNEIEITDVIQNMINSKERITPIFFKGDYLNITHLKDLQKAEKILSK